MIEWIEVMKDPKIMIPAIVSAFFTLIGAFLGVFLSSKSAFKLAKINRQYNLSRELHDFQVILESIELAIPHIHSHESLDSWTKVELSIMINRIRDGKYIEKLEEVNKPTNIGAIDINNVKNSFCFLDHCLNEDSDIEKVFSAYQSFRREIRRLRKSFDKALKY